MICRTGDLNKFSFKFTLIAKKIGLFLSIIALAACLFSVPMTQAEEEASFDDATFDETPSAPAGGQVNAAALMAMAKEKFNIKLYLDFMFHMATGDAEDDDLGIREPDYGAFGTNHSFLLITANPNDKMRIGFDITFNEYFEVEYALTPKFFIKGGLIYLPFGDFRYHSIYGGKVPTESMPNNLFPTWFTDYGLAFDHEILDSQYLNLRYAGFVSNGFGESGQTVNMNSIGVSEKNSDKAYGGRVQAILFGAYKVTASGMYDKWAKDKADGGTNDKDAFLRLTALDIASTRGLLNVPVLKLFNVKLGYLDNHVENDKAADPALQEYNAYGSYAELSVKLTRHLMLMGRYGEVDPNENVDDEKDQENYNGTIMYSVNENLHLMAMYQRNKEKYVDEVDNDYAMVKAIVEF